MEDKANFCDICGAKKEDSGRKKLYIMAGIGAAILLLLMSVAIWVLIGRFCDNYKEKEQAQNKELTDDDVGVNFLGVWRATNASYDGEEISGSDMPEITIELKQDGTCQLTNGATGEEEEGIWYEIENGVRVTDASGTSMDMKWDDGKLFMSESGVEIFFEKQ